MPLFFEFVLALAAIVVAASLFTNAAEILGGRLGLRQGAVGSLLAAVGTALPETTIPLVAVLVAALSGGEAEVASEIGIGAILGAPFMLATLAMFVVGASALAFRHRREQGAEVFCGAAIADRELRWCRLHGKGILIDEATVSRDVGFFLIFFAVAALTGIVELPLPLRLVVAVLLLAAYAYYVRVTLRSGATLEEVPERLTLWRFGSRPPTWAVVFQTLLALALIVGGAQLFVVAVEGAAQGAGLPASLVALVLAPLATELPEKLNSVFWVRDGKDTLALGNVTGAMVFQTTIPVAFGVLFTPWDLGALNLFSVVLALFSGGFVYAMLKRPGPINSSYLMVGGAFYLAFLTGAVYAVA